MPMLNRSALAAVLALGLGFPAMAQDTGPLDKEKAEAAHKRPPVYSPYADRDFPTRPFFGDTHLHTSFSMDAGAFGARIDPRDAYRFARGRADHGLQRPAGEALASARFPRGRRSFRQYGLLPRSVRRQPRNACGSDRPSMVRHGPVRQGRRRCDRDHRRLLARHVPEGHLLCPGKRAYRNAWQETIAAAEDYNEPGRFTAFIGYEWTSNTGGNNLHRNVIFRDNADKASQVEPFTVYPPGSDNPVELWKWMDAYEKKTGGSVLAIAHNGNLSNGRMFPDRRGIRQEDRPGIRRGAREMGAALRSHANQRHRRGASGRFRRMTSLPPSRSGTRAIWTAASPRSRKCSNSNMPARR